MVQDTNERNTALHETEEVFAICIIDARIIMINLK